MSDSSEYSALLPKQVSNTHSTDKSIDGTTEFNATTRHVQNEGELELKVYKRRWYVLLVYGGVAMTCCCVWNTFSPISEVCERVFHWNTGTLSLLSNWGPITFMISAGVSSWVLDEKGLRPACVMCAFLIATGTALRCLSSDPSVATPLIHIDQFLNGLVGPVAMGAPTALSVMWFPPEERATATAIAVNIKLIHIGQFLNGLAGPVAMGAPTALSVTWFPPEERATATAIAVNINTLGLAVSFLLGPYLVPVLKINTNSTCHNDTVYDHSNPLEETFGEPSPNHTCDNNTGGYDIQGERNALMLYMYYSCGWAVLCLLCILAYFPNRPPKPPSKSASVERVDYFQGLKKLARNRTFLLICLTYGLPFGIMDSWNGVLDVNLKDHNISQSDAAWLGFYGVIAGIAAALVIARCADIYSRHLKTILMVLFVIATAAFLVFAVSLAGLGFMPSNKGVLFPSYITGNLMMNAASPLFFEASCEVTHPVAEGVTTLVLAFVNNVAGLLFLLVQTVPNIGTMWENWCVVAGTCLCIPALLLTRETYNRLDIDIAKASDNDDVHA